MVAVWRVLGLLVVLGVAVGGSLLLLRWRPSGRDLLAGLGAGSGQGSMALGVLAFGLLSLPLTFGLGLRAGVAVVLAVLPSLAACLAGAFWLRRVPVAGPGPGQPVEPGPSGFEVLGLRAPEGDTYPPLRSRRSSR